HYCAVPARLMRHRAARSKQEDKSRWSQENQRAMSDGNSQVRLALFEPDIPQNTGTILRLAACLGIGVDLIEPLGFALTDERLRRAGLDYWEQAAMTRHVSFAAFDGARRAEGRRLVLFSTRGAADYTEFCFAAADTLFFGRESAGVPDPVAAAADVAL